MVKIKNPFSNLIIDNKNKKIIKLSVIAIVLAIISMIILIIINRNNELLRKENDINNIKYEVLSPVASEDNNEVDCITVREKSVENKKIGLLYNDKVLSMTMKDYIKDKLDEKYVNVSFSEYNYEVHNGEFNEDDDQSGFEKWLKNVDIVINFAIDCKSSAKTALYLATNAEKSGRATVSVAINGMQDVLSQEKDNLNMPSLRVVYLNLKEHNNSEKDIKTQVNNNIDKIEEALINKVTEKERNMILDNSSDIIYTGTYTEVDEFFYQNGWSDGLPIVPPTRELVNEMLRGTDLDENKAIGVISPSNKVVTVKNVAVNAVMAGCIPTDFPVILATLKCMFNSELKYDDISESLCSATNFITVSGDIVYDINIDNTTEAFGTKTRCNSSISRAINLIAQNIGESGIAEKNNGVFGNSMSYSSIYGEYDMRNVGIENWENIPEQMEKDSNDNIVTVTFATAYKYVDVEGETCDDIINAIFDVIENESSKEMTIIITSAMAELLYNEGYSVDKISEKAIEKVGVFSPSDISISVVQGDSLNEIICVSCCHDKINKQYQVIELPAEWEELIKDYGYGTKTYDAKYSVEMYNPDKDETVTNQVMGVVDTENYNKQGYTDGLPVIVVSDERYNAVLHELKYKPDTVVGKFADKNVTVKDVLINSIMAGCQTEYIPVVISAIEYMGEIDDEILEIIENDPTQAFVWNIYGNIIEEINLNNKGNVLDTGYKSNVSIGRAINFVIRNNISKKEDVFCKTPGNFSMLLANSTSDMKEGWGNDKESSIDMTVCDSYVYKMTKGWTYQDYLDCIKDVISGENVETVNILMTSKEAEIITAEGISKEMFIDNLISSTDNKLKKDNLKLTVIDNDSMTCIGFLLSDMEITKSVVKIEDKVESDNNYKLLTNQAPKSLTIANLPNKIQYVADSEKFDPSGIKVKAEYENGIVQILTEEFLSFSVSDIVDMSDETIKVYYYDVETSFDIEIVPRVIEKLIIAQKPDKMKYEEGEEFDSSGIRLTAIINSGDKMEVKINSCEVSAPEKLTAIDNKILISYGLATAVLELDVGNKELNSYNELNVDSFDVVRDKNDDNIVDLSAKVSGGSGKYEYRFFYLKNTYIEYVALKEMQHDKEYKYIESNSEIIDSLEWYFNQLNPNGNSNMINDYSKKSKISTEFKENGDIYIVCQVKDSSGATALCIKSLSFENEQKENEYTIRVKNVDGYEQTPNIYVWYDEDNILSSSWPGTVMENDSDMGEGWYKYTFTTELEYYNCIVSYGSKGEAQTIDMNNNNNDIWIEMKTDRIRDEGANAFEIYSRKKEVKEKSYKVYIKLADGSNFTPYVYLWNSTSSNIVGAWPGTKAIKDTSLGDDWYYVTFDCESNYNIIVNDPAAITQTSEISNESGDTWIVMHKNTITKDKKYISVYDEYDNLEKNYTVLARMESGNIIPTITIWKKNATGKYENYVNKVVMQEYIDLEGNWYYYDFTNNYDYMYQITQGKLESPKIETKDETAAIKLESDEDGTKLIVK